MNLRFVSSTEVNKSGNLIITRKNNVFSHNINFHKNIYSIKDLWRYKILGTTEKYLP